MLESRSLKSNEIYIVYFILDYLNIHLTIFPVRVCMISISAKESLFLRRENQKRRNIFIKINDFLSCAYFSPGKNIMWISYNVNFIRKTNKCGVVTTILLLQLRGQRNRQISLLSLSLKKFRPINVRADREKHTTVI